MEAHEAIRRRAGMYVGWTDGRGVMQLVCQVIGLAFDAYLADRCARIDVAVETDGTIVVIDDGPGLAVDPSAAQPSLHRILTTFTNLPNLDGPHPYVHLAPSGVGLVVVSALCETLEVITVCAGVEARVRCARGVLVEAIAVRAVDRPSGTQVRFRPDPEIFSETQLPREELSRHLDELAFLAPGLALAWSFAPDGDARRGLAGLVGRHGRGPVFQHRGRYPTETGPIDVEVALSWRTGTRPEPALVHSFVNLARTPAHGTHVLGLYDGLAAARPELDDAARTVNLVAAVSVILAEPHFGSRPTRDRLDTPAVRPVVAAATRTALGAS